MENEEDVRRINEDIAERFHRIEEKLSGARGIAGMFETLFDGVENELGVPFVWLTMIDSESSAVIIAEIKSSAVLKDRLSVVKPELLETIFSAGRRPVLVNKNLKSCFRLLPSRNKYFVRSLAIVPLIIHDEIVGSWNNGDASINRYSPEMETGLLQKFSRLVSLRLTELVGSM